jgi:hypothetical protein
MESARKHDAGVTAEVMGSVSSEVFLIHPSLRLAHQ